LQSPGDRQKSRYAPRAPVQNCSRSQKFNARSATLVDPFPVHPKRRIAALDSGFSRGLSCSSAEFGGEMLVFGLSNIAQKKIQIRINMRVRRATSWARSQK
jgi:hypothetical protein